MSITLKNNGMTLTSDGNVITIADSRSHRSYTLSDRDRALLSAHLCGKGSCCNCIHAGHGTPALSKDYTDRYIVCNNPSSEYCSMMIPETYSCQYHQSSD